MSCSALNKAALQSSTVPTMAALAPANARPRWTAPSPPAWKATRLTAAATNPASRQPTPASAIHGGTCSHREWRGVGSPRRRIKNAATTAAQAVTTNAEPNTSLGRWLALATSEHPTTLVKSAPIIVTVERNSMGATNAAATLNDIATAVCPLGYDGWLPTASETSSGRPSVCFNASAVRIEPAINTPAP